MKTLTHKIKFGIVGCGMIANVHAKAISEIAEAELVGASDNSYDCALKFAQKYHKDQKRDFRIDCRMLCCI